MEKDSLANRAYTGDIDPVLLDFLNQYVDSFIKWDLMRFFFNNPHTIDTVDNIARYAGRNQETVGQELAELAERGLLEETHMGALVVYALSADPELRDRLTRFIQASEDRQFRIRAIYHVIKGSY
ncbi:MAG TPA: hypothetical protein PLM06_08050 [Anaerolineae bacterium]|nr:hypothetical protein [Anaerolineae bacterium]